MNAPLKMSNSLYYTPLSNNAPCLIGTPPPPPPLAISLKRQETAKRSKVIQFAGSVSCLTMHLVQWQAQNKDKLIMTTYNDPKYSDIDQSRRFGRGIWIS